MVDVDIFETEAAELYPFLSALLLVHSLLARGDAGLEEWADDGSETEESAGDVEESAGEIEWE